MTLLADIVSITTHPDTGKAIVRVRDHGYKVLGGAALHDLVDRGRLGRTGEGRKSRVVVLDPSPVPEPSLEYGLARVREHAEQWPRNAVLRLGGGTKLRDGIYGGLVTEGVLGPRRKAGLFGARYPVLDPRHRDDLLARLHRTLVDGMEPDEITRRLAALLAVGDGDTGPLLGIVLDRPGARMPENGPARREVEKRVKQRGMELAKEDWIALTTLRAIELPQQIVKTTAIFGIVDASIPR